MKQLGNNDGTGLSQWRHSGDINVNSDFLCFTLGSSMSVNATFSPQDGQTSPPFTRTNTSSTTLYFDAMPSMSSLFNKPRVQSRPSSPERGIKTPISAPIPTDSVPNSNPPPINGDTNTGEVVEDDKTTLRAGGSTHGDNEIVYETTQLSSPVRTELGAPEMSRHGNDSAYDVTSAVSTRQRSSSHSEENHGTATDDMSLHCVPVVYANPSPEGEDVTSNRSQTDVSRKVSAKRTPSKLVKRRSTKGKQTEYLANGNVRGGGNASRRSTSQASQRSFRSSRGPIFDMVTVPPNATIENAGGAFGSGAVMAAPESEVEDEFRAGLLERATIAESNLTKKQTIRIHKEECSS